MNPDWARQRSTTALLTDRPFRTASRAGCSRPRVQCAFLRNTGVRRVPCRVAGGVVWPSCAERPVVPFGAIIQREGAGPLVQRPLRTTRDGAKCSTSKGGQHERESRHEPGNCAQRDRTVAERAHSATRGPGPSHGTGHLLADSQKPASREQPARTGPPFPRSLHDGHGAAPPRLAQRRREHPLGPHLGEGRAAGCGNGGGAHHPLIRSSARGRRSASGPAPNSPNSQHISQPAL